ncbi:unnamed protein product, partial [Dibothriocephalus latus]
MHRPSPAVAVWHLLPKDLQGWWLTRERSTAAFVNDDGDGGDVVSVHCPIEQRPTEAAIGSFSALQLPGAHRQVLRDLAIRSARPCKFQWRDDAGSGPAATAVSD